MRGVRAALRRAKVARILYSRKKEGRVIDYKVVVRMKSEESRETAGVRRDRIKRLISWKWKRKLLEGSGFSTTRTQKAYIFLRKKEARTVQKAVWTEGKEQEENWKDWWRGRGREMNEEEEEERENADEGRSGSEGVGF